MRDQRLQEPAPSGFCFEPNTRGEFRACRAEIVAPAGRGDRICCSPSSTGSVCAGHRCATRMFAECAVTVLLLQSLGAVTAACSDGPRRRRRCLQQQLKLHSAASRIGTLAPNVLTHGVDSTAPRISRNQERQVFCLGFLVLRSASAHQHRSTYLEVPVHRARPASVRAGQCRSSS